MLQSGFRNWIEWLLFGVIVISSRLMFGISHPPVGDELFQFLAAVSWVESGTFQLVDGVYDRAALYIVLIGFVLEIVGSNLESARLVSLMFGVLWLLVYFAWARIYLGKPGAWISALFFILSAHAMELSVYVRMYSLHGLLFLIGSLSIFRFVELQDDGMERPYSFLLVGLICLAVSFHLQPTTLIGLFGILCACIVVLPQVLLRLWIGNWKLIVAGSLSLLGIGIYISFAVPEIHDLVKEFWTRYRFQAYATEVSNVFWYYDYFFKQYGFLWLVTPILTVFAVLESPKVAGFSAILFLVCFIAHSLSGRIGERYIFYVVPFLFLLWGIGIAYVGNWIATFLQDKSLALSANVVALSFALLLIIPTDNLRRTVNLALGTSYFFGSDIPDWEVAESAVQPIIESADVVVTTDFLRTTYYFGDFDIVYSPVIVHDIVGGQENAIDPRTGRPAIGSLESLKEVMRRSQRGVIVGNGFELGSRLRVTPEAHEYLNEHASRLSLPSESGMFAYTWNNTLDTEALLKPSKF